MEIRKLRSHEARFTLNDEKISEIEQLSSSPEIIGQPRALRAIRMGTEIQGRGYNIFVTGLSGTGRTTAIKKILSTHIPRPDRIKDVVYVYNFKDPDSPKPLYLSPGGGEQLKKEIHQLVEDMKDLIGGKLESDSFKNKRDKIISLVEKEENNVISAFEGRLRKEGFQVVQIQENDDEATDITPLFKGKPTDFDTLQEMVAQGKLEESYWDKTRKQYYELMDELKRMIQDLKESRSTLEKELDVLKSDTVSPGIDMAVDKLMGKYSDPEIRGYLEDVKKDIKSHIYLFQKEQPVDESGTPALIRYGVNILVDNKEEKRGPVIFENHPTYSNLFGTIESRLDLNGENKVNFLMIKAGSLIKASGGFIVLKAEDILKEEEVWENLKRTLQNGMVEIQPVSGPLNLQTVIIKPGPVRVDVKVILVGNENLYDYLYFKDPDFHKYFKITAEFDSVMDFSPENIGNYIGFIRMIIADEGLQNITRNGIAEVVRYGLYLSEQKDKLSTRFSLIADLIREANYWAAKKGKKEIDRESVETALRERKFLHSLPEEKIFELIKTGEMILSVKGSRVGKVNGLAIHDRGYYSFGVPTVISARVAPGNEGIINIEREVGLSGEIHDKGVLIIEGYLRDLYAQSFPMSVYASICFEQSYSEVDGDSASSTEIYALLSAITSIPLNQEIAVTGSVNQMGEIQPVGGISEKVEGFYSTCKKIGFTGGQGVIIPEKNILNLLLSNEICEALDKGIFHIYPVSTIDEGITILTGIPAGERDKKGKFPDESVNGKAEARLREMADQVKNYSG